MVSFGLGLMKAFFGLGLMDLRFFAPDVHAGQDTLEDAEHGLLTEEHRTMRWSGFRV